MPPSFSRPGVRGTSPAPGASVEKSGSRCLTTCFLAADHHAVTAFQAPHAAAGSDVDIVDALRCEFLAAPDVVDVIGIAAVDQDVLAVQVRQQVGDGLSTTAAGTISQTARGFSSFLTRSMSERGSSRLFLDQLVHRFRRPVEDDALMASSREAGAPCLPPSVRDQSFQAA